MEGERREHSQTVMSSESESDTAPRIIRMMGLRITHMQMAVVLSFHVLGDTDSTLFAVQYCTHTSRQL